MGAVGRNIYSFLYFLPLSYSKFFALRYSFAVKYLFLRFEKLSKQGLFGPYGRVCVCVGGGEVTTVE